LNLFSAFFQSYFNDPRNSKGGKIEKIELIRLLAKGNHTFEMFSNTRKKASK
jgi:hypothetical protein